MDALRLDWVDAKTARMACERWHYSRRVPVYKTVRVGVWEAGRFVGVVMYGGGSTPEIGKPFGMRATEVCELVRVALTHHTTPVSRIIAISLRMLKQQSPHLKLVVSFADSKQGHTGGIYQAGGWLYVGSFVHHVYRVCGEEVHPKTLHSRYGVGGQSIPWLRSHVDPLACRVTTPEKYKYVMPLDNETRTRILPMSKPYPKRAVSTVASAPLDQSGEGGSNPTTALSNV